MSSFLEASSALVRLQVAKRRAVLVAAGCSTYRVGVGVNDGFGKPRMIICLCCGLTSLDTDDIARKFCDFCQEHHSEWSAEI